MASQGYLSQTWVTITLSTFCVEVIIICICSVIRSAPLHPKSPYRIISYQFLLLFYIKTWQLYLVKFPCLWIYNRRDLIWSPEIWGKNTKMVSKESTRSKCRIYQNIINTSIIVNLTVLHPMKAPISTQFQNINEELEDTENILNLFTSLNDYLKVILEKEDKMVLS